MDGINEFLKERDEQFLRKLYTLYGHGENKDSLQASQGMEMYIRIN